MPTSLQGIAKKAAHDKSYRFRNLFGMLTVAYVLSGWPLLNKRAASGVDRISVRTYGERLHDHVTSLVERVKNQCYRAKLVRRHYIPKGNGALRPLGIPATEDKLLQTAVARILEAIYEQDFLASSYGYRKKIGARDAVRDLTRHLQFGPYGYVVEADIKGYFDHIDHERLMEMLRWRIDDRPFLGLIRKWLKAGVLDTDGQVLHPVTGLPQGGIVSPILANLYLHHVLDVWFAEVVQPHCEGQAALCRYADDFVCAFQYKRDAERFYGVLGKRLAKYGLELAPEKTRLLRFSRYQKDVKNRFDFLGFTFFWGTDRMGKDRLQRRTARSRLKKALSNFTAWIKRARNQRLLELMNELNSKLRGYYNYYGVRGNSSSLAEFSYHVERLLYKWLNRRSQKTSYTWQGFKDLLKQFAIARPRITEPARTRPVTT
jgi:group II intron reverse transcriptase/maturase